MKYFLSLPPGFTWRFPRPPPERPLCGERKDDRVPAYSKAPTSSVRVRSMKIVSTLPAGVLSIPGPCPLPELAEGGVGVRLQLNLWGGRSSPSLVSPSADSLAVSHAVGSPGPGGVDIVGVPRTQLVWHKGS